MLVALVIVNVILIIALKIYVKLSCGFCKSSRHLVGKVAIVTGANTGIGYETAKNLAERGAKVILACRSESLGEAACSLIEQETGNNDVHFKHLDLASLKSVRNFAKDILENEKRLDILVNNAGAYALGNKKTEDDLPIGIQTNHLGPFLLTNLLLPVLKQSAPSRIINVSSMLHTRAKLNFDDLNKEVSDRDFDDYQVYCDTKLCNVLISNELSRRLKGSGVTSNALHPGLVKTDIMRENTGIKSFVSKFIVKLLGKTAWEGAQTQIYMAVSPEVEKVSGKYFSDCKEKLMSNTAEDEDLAKKLWKKSEELTGLKKLNN